MLGSIFNILKAIGDFFVNLASIVTSFFRYLYDLGRFLLKIGTFSDFLARGFIGFIPAAIMSAILLIITLSILFKFIGQRN